MQDFVSIARIVKTRGVRGELAADLLTDFPERFGAIERVRILRNGQELWEDIEDFWFHGNRVILKFTGRDTPEAASELISSEVQIPAAERFQLPPDHYYYDDLIGCQVVENGQVLGEVVEILELSPETVNLVCRGLTGREFMVPLVHALVRQVDIEKRILDVELPPGLLD